MSHRTSRSQRFSRSIVTGMVGGTCAGIIRVLTEWICRCLFN
jgi:hypothetical protein